MLPALWGEMLKALFLNVLISAWRCSYCTHFSTSYEENLYTDILHRWKLWVLRSEWKHICLSTGFHTLELKSQNTINQTFQHSSKDPKLHIVSFSANKTPTDTLINPLQHYCYSQKQTGLSFTHSPTVAQWNVRNVSVDITVPSSGIASQLPNTDLKTVSVCIYTLCL